jgi:sugar lactone lactonase YvrE
LGVRVSNRNTNCAKKNSKFTFLQILPLVRPFLKSYDAGVSSRGYLSGGHRAGWLLLVSGFVLLTARPCFAGGSASLVLGQFDFVHNGVNIVTNFGLWTPQAVAIDRSVTPNRLYVADAGNHRVLGWHSIAALENGDPADLVIGQPDFLSWGAQCSNAAVTGATLCFPSGVAVDPSGNLYVVDQGNSRVLEYDDPFTTDTLPDLVFGQGGSFTSFACNKGGKINAATLCNPNGVAVDAAGNVYISDSGNSRALEYDLPLVSDVQADRVFGQNGSFTTATCNMGGVSANSLCRPAALALDSAGNLYLEDNGNFRVLEYNSPLKSITANLVFGQSNSFASNVNPCPATPTAGAVCTPAGLALDSADNLYVSDSSFARIQEFNDPVKTGNTSPDLVLGQPDFNSSQCNNGGVGASSVCLPDGIATDTSGDLFLADSGNQRVLEYIKPLGTTPPNTKAGLVLGQSSMSDNGVNAAKINSLYGPAAVAIDASVSPNRLYVADTNNSRILGWSSVASFTNGAPAKLVIGQPGLSSAGCNQNRVDAAGASLPAADTLCVPAGVAVDGAGNLWVADSGNYRVLQYNAPFSSGMTADQPAMVVLGQGGSFTTRIENNGGVSAASMSAAAGLAIDTLGGLYVADPNNNRVLKFNAPSAAHPNADTVFGQGGDFLTNVCNFDGICGGSGCSATADSLCRPSAVGVDTFGNLYIADTANNRVLHFPAGSSGNPTANVVIGQSDFIGTSCGTLCQPQGVAVDASGNLFAADAFNDQIDQYKAPLATGQTPALIIGTKLCGQAQTLANTLCGVSGMALDSANDLFAADTLDNRVLEFRSGALPTPSPTPSATATPTATAAPPTATPTPKPGVPFISALPAVIQTGSSFGLTGSGFTAGSRVNFFVPTATGVINTGPFKPVAFTPTHLTVSVPASNPLGEGVVSVQVVNTDEGYTKSNIQLALLQGNPALGIPSITAINSTTISPQSTDPSIALANVETVVVQGTTVTLGGKGFDAVHGIAIDLFCACPGGKVGPFFISPSLGLTPTSVIFNLPGSGPRSPATGPGSFVISNGGSDGLYSVKSNAVSVAIGEAITVTSVVQSAEQITVFGAGFSPLTVINFFNTQGTAVFNLGGLTSGGKPRIALTLINSGEFIFPVPSTARAGASYVQAINPPFIPFTSSGNAPGGAFTLR